ncbi:replication-relaxation family protein [Herbiconiux sp. CPCC 203386]|uniref:Replication-relaxation family protein n=2 Tax=Herbiconiux daphne TaxID=2970914 RepID=A0ABT2H535_9MICO|nr:replication-relaxation family protein [Herbiconiux daphne]
MGLTRLREHANERDLAIIRSIRAFKFLTTRHVYELHFALHASYVSGIRACTRVLTRLESHRFITRLPRSVGGTGGGSTSTVWSVGPAGDRLLRSGSPDQPAGRSRSFEPTLMFLSHTLAIADLRVLLEQHARAGELELLDVQPEPHNWRKFTGRSGRLLTLKPDLTTVSAIGDEELFHFWEVDLGTEPIHRLIDKCRSYQQYYDSGIEQAKTGVFPQVVWLLGDERRRQRLRQALSADSSMRNDLFLISTPDRLSGALSSEPAAAN